LNQLSVFSSLHATALLSFSHIPGQTSGQFHRLTPGSPSTLFLCRHDDYHGICFPLLLDLYVRKVWNVDVASCFKRLWSVVLQYDSSCMLREYMTCRSQWPPGLRCGSASLAPWDCRFQSRRRTWISVCCECCELSDRGPCDRLITRPEESYRVWCVSVIMRPQKWGGPEPLVAFAPWGIHVYHIAIKSVALGAYHNLHQAMWQ